MGNKNQRNLGMKHELGNSPWDHGLRMSSNVASLIACIRDKIGVYI